MALKISHTTHYSYDTPVVYGLQKVRLRPLSSVLQNVEDWDISIDGGRIEASYIDHYGNHTDLVSATPGSMGLTLVAQGRVKTSASAGILGQVYGVAPLWHFRQQAPLTHPDSAISDLAGVVQAAGAPLDGLHALSSAILEKVPYEAGKTGTSTTAAQAIEVGFGVCQDHANIFVSAARVAGLPARYVSGYLRMSNQTDQDASHAWAEAHVDGLGWVGFDVSNGVSPDEGYVRIAVGRDAAEAAPISGLRMGAGDEAITVKLQVQQ